MELVITFRKLIKNDTIGGSYQHPNKHEIHWFNAVLMFFIDLYADQQHWGNVQCLVKVHVFDQCWLSIWRLFSLRYMYDEWINEWTNECINGWMNEWMNKWMNNKTSNATNSPSSVALQIRISSIFIVHLSLHFVDREGRDTDDLV